uniref:Uncharacterized protein n=1 Tax=Tanacetum cinerariifolium TaxID=118510 RepID=A0A6L2NFD9_TANCI|nr:hypothetical protein [Tanacetum cinerariifolium]
MGDVMEDVLEDNSMTRHVLTANVVEEKKQEEVRNVIKDEKLQVCAIIETHVKAAKMSDVYSKSYGNAHEKVTNLKEKLKIAQAKVDANPYDAIIKEEEAKILLEYTEEMKVTDAEIKEALFDIGDNKSPGPDGYIVVFFKKHVVGQEVCLDINEFFYFGKLFTQLNATLITLVLKSAFILGSIIHDNILLSQELLNGYDRKMGPKRCALKIDIAKAYDTVNWDFLVKILHQFGFHEKMVYWIKTCNSVRYLGVSLITKRISLNDYKMLVDKGSYGVVVNCKEEKLKSHGNLCLILKIKSVIGPLDQHISKREIYDARLVNNATVDEIISNGRWKWWPKEWMLKFPLLQQVDVPLMQQYIEDHTMWHSNNGSIRKFSTKQVWKDCIDQLPNVP